MPKAGSGPPVRYRFVMFANLQLRSMLSALTSTKPWATALILPAAVVFAAVAGANPGGELPTRRRSAGVLPGADGRSRR